MHNSAVVAVWFGSLLHVNGYVVTRIIGERKPSSATVTPFVDTTADDGMSNRLSSVTTTAVKTHYGIVQCPTDRTTVDYKTDVDDPQSQIEYNFYEEDKDKKNCWEYDMWNTYIPIICIAFLVIVYPFCYYVCKTCRKYELDVIYLQTNNCRCTAKYYCGRI